MTDPQQRKRMAVWGSLMILFCLGLGLTIAIFIGRGIRDDLRSGVSHGATRSERRRQVVRIRDQDPVNFYTDIAFRIVVSMVPLGICGWIITKTARALRASGE